MKPISTEKAQAMGIEAVHHEMGNGEKRFRLTSLDGSSYIRTESAEAGAWQNSHFHKCVQEIYIVEKGWIAYAELTDAKALAMRIVHRGECVQVKPARAHNIYMPPDSITHVVKHGGNSQVKPDWFACPELDDLTHALSEQEILDRCKTEKE